MQKMIVFDLDGTIVDLYGVENWEPMLRAESVIPYIRAKPMCDMEKLREVLLKLSAHGWEIRVVTWLAKDSSNAYKAMVTAAKREWLKHYNFPVDKCHFIQYGATKANSVRGAYPAILIDDNRKVRKGWTLGGVIDPVTQDIITELERIAADYSAAGDKMKYIITFSGSVEVTADSIDEAVNVARDILRDNALEYLEFDGEEPEEVYTCAVCENTETDERYFCEV